ncbi:CDP-glycerol glycerophosphotransferase family protein [Terrilactibacillus sp. S3-3]|nr:CDP-glycerol glycerophosphotransferase family protein [Terrilactibacillus sp. S3-3]
MKKKKKAKILKRKIKFILDPLKRYRNDKEFRMRASYTKYLSKKKIRNNTILYEAYHGQSMTGNPYAVFKYLIKNPKYRSFTHVWAINDKSVVPSEYQNKSNIYFVEPRSKQYNKYLATAKYLINDTTFPYYFQKKKKRTDLC